MSSLNEQSESNSSTSDELKLSKPKTLKKSTNPTKKQTKRDINNKAISFNHLNENSNNSTSNSQHSFASSANSSSVS